MNLPIDWMARATWVAAGAALAAAIPLIVFLSGDELALTIVVAVVGAGAGFAAWPLAMGERR